MKEQEPLTEDLLFLALTRPTMWLGVPIEGTILIGMVTVLILMAFGNPLYALAVGGSLLVTARIVVKSDFNMFRLLFLWTKTKMRSRNREHWGGSSYSPLPTEGQRRKGFYRGK